MKQYLVTGVVAVILLSSCGSSSKEKNAALNDKKVALEKLKGEKEKMDDQIKKLETDINTLDPASANVQKPKLVSVQTLATANFDHYIELQGRIESENISYVTPRGMGGVVKAIYVKQGDHVRKGQLLMKLDDAVARQSLSAAKEGLESIKTQLSYAKNIYQRQKNLWDQNIGTEVQVITAKNNVSTLENQLSAAQENVKVVQEQLDQNNVYSEVNGVADIVNIKVGETFTAAGANGLGIMIVNNSQLKVTANIPENYLGNVRKGSPVIVSIPDIGKTINSSVSFVGSTINALSRGFVVEAKLPADPSVKPNQISLLKIKDYAAANSIAVPVATLQNDEKGKFVMVAVNENNKLVARKRAVNIGLLNGDVLEIKTGLKAGDVLITEGFQSLYDGQVITTQ
ncbi:MAG: efflux RND transporter periplasmic adaptor subunit [Ferruginibacter sp.]